MHRPTREKLRQLLDQDPEKILDLIETLYDAAELSASEIAVLEAEIKRLKDQQSKNSRTSHKPPSSDGPAKRTQSLRGKSGRSAGGQKGHKGYGLKRVKTPDHEIMLPAPPTCPCGCDLSGILHSDYETRQVLDLPPIAIEATDYKAEVVQCPSCREFIRSDFPSIATRPVQYGPRLKAIAAYLINQHLMPYKRTAEILEDLFGQSVSTGTLYNINRDLFRVLETPAHEIKEQISASPVAHFDETGSRVAGKGNWIHTASTDQAAFYTAHAKRGFEAMEEIGILSEFKGIAVHDHLKSYFKYDCRHGLCNAHHLRELTFLVERHKQAWAEKMINLLLSVKKDVDKAKSKGKRKLTPAVISGFEKNYAEIVEAGFLANPDYDPKRKRKKRTDPQRMLHRLKDFQPQVLAFMYDFHVPFDNNLAERDLRMIKVRQKISGCFRKHSGAEIFCRIKSCLTTARKRGINQFDILLESMMGKSINF